MTQETTTHLYLENSPGKSVKRKWFSPEQWQPKTLMVFFCGWIILAELTDVFFLHKLSFTSSLSEGLLDTLVLLFFISPIYLLLYLPLKSHWVQQVEAQREVRLLNQKLLVAAEDERRKLAYELHDHFGQAVTSLQCGVEKLHRQLSQEQSTATEACQALEDTVSQLGIDIRRFVSDLRPDVLDDLGLAEALKWHIGELQQQHPGLGFGYQPVGIKRRLPADIEIALYRICQEALNNVIKHARADHVMVSLTCSHPLIILAVRDDGVGLPIHLQANSKRQAHGMGLLSIKELAAGLGGTLELNSKPGEGTIVRVTVWGNGGGN